MSYARARAVRGLQSALRSSGARATPRVSAPARTQLAVGRRYASSEGGAHGEATSDIPWLAGAIAVTIPSCSYLWPTSHADSGHHGAHGEHDEHDEEGTLGGEDHSDGDSVVPKAIAEALPESVENAVEDALHNTSDKDGEGSDDAPKEEDTASQEEGEKEDSLAAKGDAAARSSTEQQQTSEASYKASGSQGEGQDTSSTTPTEDSQAKEGGSESGKGKGNMSADSAGTGDERKREPDSKGGFKKRIDSGLQKDLGGSKEQFDDDGSEKAATSKPPAKDDSGQITGKQFGMSNTPTRHSLQIDEDPEKSKKAEGGPDTAKVMGTVDSNRPAK